MLSKYKTKNLETVVVEDTRNLIERSKDLYSEKIAFKEIGPNKEILEYSYRKLFDDVNSLGTKLLEMGLKDKHIAILGENSYLWVVSYLAIITGLGVVIPMDKELFEDDILKLLRESDSEVIICSETYIDDVKRISSRYPELKTHICMNSKGEHPGFHVIEELIKDGIDPRL